MERIGPIEVTHPDKLYYPSLGVTKRQVIAYYEAVAGPVLRAVRDRPIVLKRFPEGIGGSFFYQKRAPRSRPAWVRTVTYRFPSGRTADEVVIDDLPALLWVAQLGNIELHAHPVRADDLEHPDELRIDLDPGPAVSFGAVRDVAVVTREVLRDHGLTGFPKTSGGSGLHVYARIHRRWPFADVRRAALAVAREVAERVPRLATARWWKEERHGVFLDYNQNARDRTMAAAYSLRATADARVSTPLAWDEVPHCDPAWFTIATVPRRLAEVGDPAAPMTSSAGSLEPLLELADRQERDRPADAPWPPHHPKAAREPVRAAPSRRRAPLVTVAKAAREEDALAGLERWRARHPEAAAHVRPEDVLVDEMRGRSSTWTRIRVNLRRVPPALRPENEPPDPDVDQ